MLKILFVFVFVILDFLSKKIIFLNIDLNNFVYVTSFFELGHIHNFGISFGLLSNVFSSFLLVLLGTILTVILFIMYLKSDKIFEQWGYIFIISGALSNILDRAINGYVLDFLYFHFKEFDWFLFNFADIYISIGFFIIVLQILYDMNRRLVKIK